MEEEEEVAALLQLLSRVSFSVNSNWRSCLFQVFQSKGKSEPCTEGSWDRKCWGNLVLGAIHEVNDGGCTLSPQSTPSSHPLNAKCSLEMVRVRPEKKLKSHLIWRMMEWALMSSPSQPFEQGRSPLDWMPLTKSSLHKVEFSLFCIGSVNCYCASQKKISSGIQTMWCLKISLNERSSLLLNKMLRSCIREQKSLQRFSKNWILFNLHHENLKLI